MTWLISDEARKHRAFREVWVAYLLGGLYLLLGLYTEISEQNYSVLYDAQQKWNFVQQNIYSYGATLTAFLLAVGLPRLVCCEKEYRTDDLVGTAALGRRYTWRAKTAFTVLYCAAVVFSIGAASLLVNGGAFGFEGARLPVAGCVYLRIRRCRRCPILRTVRSSMDFCFWARYTSLGLFLSSLR